MLSLDIKVQSGGHVFCESGFYTAQDILAADTQYHFKSGINKMVGEIDSGIWAISYWLSMCKFKKHHFIMHEQPDVFVNNELTPITELSKITCYMDKQYPLFSTRKTVEHIIEQALKRNNLNCSSNDIKTMFDIDDDRFKRPLSGVGNEIFKAMAAIGYCNNKEVFCFPWLSSMRFAGYHRHLSDLLDILAQQNKVVILPVGHK